MKYQKQRVVLNLLYIDLYHNISYSVLEVVELTDKRILKCKNPLGHTIPSKKFDVKSVKKYKKVEVIEIFN